MAVRDQEKLLTAEDLAALPEDGKRHELIEGILVEMSRPKPRHGVIQVRLSYAVHAFVVRLSLGLVTTEAGYIVAKNPDTVLGPDVAFISKTRLPNPDLDEYIPVAPDLAVEIVSPNDMADEVIEKVEKYLNAGTRIVWVVYSSVRLILVYEPGEVAKRLSIDSTLDGGEVLPGFTLPLRELFAEIS